MKNKIVLVTGSSRGIGKSIALNFAKQGYDVIINCFQNKELLLNVKKEIEAYGVSCLAFVGDMGNYDTVKELFSEIDLEFGSLDILVNNAGISHIGLLSDMTIDEWNHIVSSNLTSVFNCCNQAIPFLLHKKQGKIINISSVWGNVGASCEVAYSATKGGINSFTKALAKELAPSNIQVNAISCGAIDTEMNQFLDEEERNALTDEIPVGRLGSTDEVAELVFQLATSNSYLTGQVIALDGGWI
ncbi:elongation factor P 5-aminopentanone reductase [Anaeromicropila herbilytica]|uniref:3-ketoacyl-ACP reductase n=1 Tax=Anaeromicropila herbilytica TaxID=2785025 RepID=A0A7R7EPY8_9FIRM|nr:SDR family oxidoreductase [Anaeromicropila herbilytica]BCN32656.1 3-ketoacyl-ACP reductase [Anaeromicropila herbilytica]